MGGVAGWLSGEWKVGIHDLFAFSGFWSGTQCISSLRKLVELLLFKQTHNVADFRLYFIRLLPKNTGESVVSYLSHSGV